MSHPSSCKDPTCTLKYIDHIRTIAFSPSAMPSRSNNADVVATNIREKRWERDHAAFRRLHKQGYTPPQIDGSRFRERAAKNEYDINCAPVTIDWSDPK